MGLRRRAQADSDTVRAQDTSRETRYVHSSSFLILLGISGEHSLYEGSRGGSVLLWARFIGSALVLSRLHVGDNFAAQSPTHSWLEHLPPSPSYYAVIVAIYASFAYRARRDKLWSCTLQSAQSPASRATHSTLRPALPQWSYLAGPGFPPSEAGSSCCLLWPMPLGLLESPPNRTVAWTTRRPFLSCLVRVNVVPSCSANARGRLDLDDTTHSAHLATTGRELSCFPAGAATCTASPIHHTCLVSGTPR